MKNPRAAMLLEGNQCGSNGSRRPAAEGPMGNRKQRQAMILVVDDDKLLVKMGVRICKKLGHEVKGTTSSNEALEIYKEGGVDLVLSDFNMPPGMNGLDLLKALKEHDPDAKVIIHAGGLGGREVEALREAGVAEIIHKPAGHGELEQIIDANI